MSILEVSNVSKSFGGVKANVDISMNVEKGKIVGLIGPNGSGKTTLFNSIVGTHPIDQRSIVFDNTEVSEMPVPAVGSSNKSIFGSFIKAIASSNNFCCPKERSPALKFLFW